MKVFILTISVELDIQKNCTVANLNMNVSIAILLLPIVFRRGRYFVMLGRPHRITSRW